MEQEKKISIIIPAYNVQNYIKQCLDSIVNQTYQNLEIIIVNDGSTDDTLSIIEKYAQNDKRFLVINQKNQGVSVSRNVALNNVSGQYIVFVDSDDWLELDACEYMLKQVEQYTADIGIFGYIREYEGHPLPKALFNEEEIVFEKIDVRNKLHRRVFGPIQKELQYPEKLNAIATMCGRIYKSSLFQNVKFVPLDKLGMCEDGYMNVFLFERANRVIFKKHYLYHYRKVISGGSLTQKKDSNIFEKEKIYYNTLNQYIANNHLDEVYIEALNNRMTISLIECGITIINSHVNVYKNIRDILYSKEYRSSCQKFSLQYLPIHWKIFFQFAKMQWTFCIYILLIAMKLLSSRK